MCWTQKFSFSRDPVFLDPKLQLASLLSSVEIFNKNSSKLIEIKIIFFLPPFFY
jgi:hypothetical protein